MKKKTTLAKILFLNGYTTDSFAEAIGTSSRTVSSWLTGKFFPGVANVQKIEQILNKKIVEIFPKILKRFDDKK